MRGVACGLRDFGYEIGPFCAYVTSDVLVGSGLSSSAAFESLMGAVFSHLYNDGRVSAVWGTHTHVQTSDSRVLPHGTGYISDLGMTGPSDSVLGIAPEQSIRKFLGDPPRRYEQAKGPGKLEGALFTVDTETGACTAVEAIRITP